MLQKKYFLACSLTIMVALTCLVIYLILNRIQGTAINKKLIIDQDGGADDAMAIFMGLLYEKYYKGPEIVAITTTHGNVDEKQVFNNTQRILTVAGRRDVNTIQGTAINKKLIIDQDGGADDAMAIFMGLLYEKYYKGPEIVAITTTHGNVDEKQVFNNTQRILTVAGRRDIPIYRGSSSALIGNYPSDIFFGYDGLGDTPKENFKPIAAQKDHAVFGLIEMSKKFKGHLIIVAVGSLTNIALAKKIDPDFMSRLSHLYIGAGHIYGDDFQQPEFNAAMDVESYHIVLEKSDPKKTTLIPFSQILIYQKISKEWRQDILGSINTKIMKALNEYETKSLNSSSFWSLLDPAAMAIALNDFIVEETRYSQNDIILCGEKRGINTNNFTSITDANSKVVYKVKKHPYKQFLYDLFSADIK